MTRNITKEYQKCRLANIDAQINELQKIKEEVENMPLFEDTLEGQIQELEKKACEQIQKICDKFHKETGRTLTRPLNGIEATKAMIDKAYDAIMEVPVLRKSYLDCSTGDIRRTR